MISKLRGLLDSTGQNWAVLDVNGVFYHVFCSARTLDEIQGVGQERTLITEMHVREDIMALYGFSTASEHPWFQTLTSVQGVGMKVALAILSVASPDQMHAAILSGDKTTFSAADGVGPKLATRLVNELKDKVAKLFGANAGGSAASATSSSTASIPVGSIFQDAASALVNLGYKPFEVNQILARLKQEGDMPGSVEALIPLALQSLTKRA